MTTSGADAREARLSTRRLHRFTSRAQAFARFIAQRAILKPVVWSVVHVTVIGRRNLRGVGRAFVVVANHSSHLDAPLILGALPRRMARYLAAGAAADYFFDVWWRRGLTALFFNAFPVDRSGANPRSISAKVLIERGVPLLVFPEGTRSRNGELGNFKSGAASLAAATGVPLRQAEGESVGDFTSRIRAEIVRLRDTYADRILGASNPSEGANA
jgi:1-acyl-sn-glycerol-3-phosphate acyltransferase